MRILIKRSEMFILEATDKKENGDIKKPEDWITLNTDLKDYSNEQL